MHILIQTFGSAGDVHPFVGLGRELQARGHEVTVLANAVFRPVLEDAGLPFVECGDAAMYARALDDPDLWHPRKGLEIVMREGVGPLLRPAYDSLAERIEPGRTLLLSSTWGFAAHLAAEKHGVPLVMTHLQPSNYRSVHRAPRYPGLTLPEGLPAPFKRGVYRLIDVLLDPVVCPPINELRRDLGLKPVRRLFKDWLHESTLLLGLFPDWFAPPQPDWPTGLHLTGFPLWTEDHRTPLDTELAAWIDDGPPPLVFTAGSANVFGSDFHRHSIATAEQLGMRAVLACRNRDALPERLPDHVRHESFPPFAALFRRAAAVVHHGGIGTLSLALAAGVPSVAAPVAFDQFDNASRLVDLGVGASLPLKRYRAGRVAPLLQRLLGDETCRSACRRVATNLAGTDALAATCDAIERTPVGC
jgi:UDP:flavonoid glycosyltransferase YjiC (YdhE family)